MSLLQFACHVFTTYASASQTNIVYTDFSIASDRVNHKVLFFTYRSSDSPSNLFKWISVYLQNRSSWSSVQQYLLWGIFCDRRCPSRQSLRTFSTCPLHQRSFIGDYVELLLMCAYDIKLFSSLNEKHITYRILYWFAKIGKWRVIHCLGG